MRARWLLAALLAAGCGGGTDGTPVAPPTTPAPAPAPPPPEPAPEPRVCTDERDVALGYLTSLGHHPPLLVEYWDGTPILVQLDETRIPENERPAAERMLAAVGRLAEQVEDQVGYRILETGGWIADGGDYRIEIEGTDIVRCWVLPPGRLAVITTIPDDAALGSAFPACGVVLFKMFDLPDFAGPHELFHLFGFGHNDETHPHERHFGGVPMSRSLTTGVNAAGTAYVEGLGVTFDDVDALRCIFPEGG